MSAIDHPSTAHRICPAKAITPQEILLTIDLVPPGYFRFKGVFDRVVAAVLLIPSILAIVASIIVVRLTTRSPAIAHQRRIGMNGRRFKKYQIQTAGHSIRFDSGRTSPDPTGPTRSLVGRLLHRLRLDGLPQLVNVLRGDMSLVGPTSERPELAVALSRQIPGYANRLAVRPGMIGVSQAILAPQDSLDDAHRKLRYDLHYIEHAGPLMDLRLMIAASLRTLGIPREWVTTATGFHRLDKITSSRGVANPGGNGTSRSDAKRPSVNLSSHRCEETLKRDGQPGDASVSEKTPSPRKPR